MLKLTLDDAKAIRMRSRDMIANNTGRNKMYREIERMEHAEYELPQEVRGLPGVHKVVSTDPHDAVRAATRVLSSIFPRIKYHPLSDGEAGKERASEIEQVLRWWFKGLNRRGNATILRDIVRSAVMYDMVAFQSVFIPHEEAAQKTLKGEAGEARKKFIMRRGPFAWRLHNPKTVFPMYSGLRPRGCARGTHDAGS